MMMWTSKKMSESQTKAGNQGKLKKKKKFKFDFKNLNDAFFGTAALSPLPVSLEFIELVPS